AMALRTTLGQATSASEASAAFAQYETALTGGSDIAAGVVGAALQVDISSALSATAAVNATVTAQSTLDSALASATRDTDVDAMADALVTARASFNQAVEAQATALAAFAQRQAAIDLLIVAQGTFRLR